MMISVYGSTGFIGSTFCKMYPDISIPIDRDNRVPQSMNCLYLISTTDNYNIFDKPFLDIDTNLKVLVETLEECKKNKDIIFNFVSSWFVYGNQSFIPVSEDAYCKPKGMYSITKYAAEQIVQSYCETFGIHYRILRLSNVYGIGDKGVSKKKNAIQYMITQLAQGKNIQLYDNGDMIRDLLYVTDICQAIRLCIDKVSVNDIINIGSGDLTSVKEIMEIALRYIDNPGNIEYIETPKFHLRVQARDMSLDNTKIKKIGFKQKVSLEEGIKKIILNLTKG